MSKRNSLTTANATPALHEGPDPSWQTCGN